MTLFVSQSEAACFLAKVEKVILQKSPARKPRYGKALSDMAFAIVRSKGPLSDSFTKADIKREMAPELARFASIPAQSTIDAAIDKAVKQWETAERARLPKSGKSGKSES